MREAAAYYDLAYNPPSFNALDFLLQAERWRLTQSVDKLKVIVLPGPMGGFRKDNLPPSGPVERTKWLNNIVIPLPRLLPSSGEDAVLGDRPHQGPSFGRNEYLIGFKTLMKMAADNLYPFKAPTEEVAKQFAKYGDRYVTITIRDTGWWVQRTTNVEQWKIVGHELAAAGYRVVFIPDGTKPDQVVEGFATDKDAAQNVITRAALYQGSQMNFGIPCGPLWLCWFMGAPVMMVKMINENEPSTRARSYEQSGLKPGSQIANARPRQRLVWKPEEASIILREFETLV